MNVAVVIGVTKYARYAPLPACKADADLVAAILRGTTRYDQVVTITENTDSSAVKSLITKLINQLSGKQIEEFFFYFSGHGDFSGEDFHYLLTDFDQSKYKQTSLSNLEIDNLIRGMSPALTIKVVDACNAGVTYVKDIGSLEKHLTKESKVFRSCYFMFSSLQTQSSYQDKHFSAFTKSFCRSILTSSQDSVRYKDIIDFVSDDFDGDTHQTPLFVNQARFTETFATNANRIKESIPKAIDLTDIAKTATSTPRTQRRNSVLTFSATESYELFGHEAAENEDTERLREYYFKSNIYDQVATDLPLRILVGHKGIGKSALFQIAMAEDRESHKVAILIKPDDIAGLGTDTTDFLLTIRNWKVGLSRIIASKTLKAIGYSVSSEVLKDVEDTSILASVRKYLLANPSFDGADGVMIESFIKRPKINVYIDDLDRGWQGMKPHIVRISALLNAVRDISTDNRGLNFRVSLRSDVYYLVRTSDESTDKIEGSVIWHSWTNHEIFALLIKRISTFFGEAIDEHQLMQSPQSVLWARLERVMEPTFLGKGQWSNVPTYRVLMSLIRKRPRDLIKLCTLAAGRANRARSSLIRTNHLEGSFEEYSQSRLQDTFNEFRSELPNVERLLMNMRPNKKERTAKSGYVYTTEELLKKIGKVKEMEPFRFATGLTAGNRELAAFMYKINFLTARRETPDGIVRRYFEENRYLQSQFSDFGFDWEIHPAYRWALQPESLNEIFKSLELGLDG
jgi:hypothetical protein